MSSFLASFLPAFLPSLLPNFLLPSCLPACLPSFLPALLPSFLPSFPPAFLPSFLPLSPRLPSFPPAFLPSFLPSFLPYSLLLFLLQRGKFLCLIVKKFFGLEKSFFDWHPKVPDLAWQNTQPCAFARQKKFTFAASKRSLFHKAAWTCADIEPGHSGRAQQA